MLNTSKDGVDSEYNQLKNTYFNAAANNGASIKLKFEEDACYDGFMFADQTKFGVPQTITMQQLAYTGIHITDGTNDYSLKEVINIVNQDNYEPQNMVEKFVKYCDLNDRVTYDSSPDATVMYPGGKDKSAKNGFASVEARFEYNADEGYITFSVDVRQSHKINYPYNNYK